MSLGLWWGERRFVGMLAPLRRNPYIPAYRCVQFKRKRNISLWFAWSQRQHSSQKHIVRWKNGARGTIEATTCASPGYATRIEIHGEKGSLLLEDSQITRFVIDGEDQPIEETLVGAGGHADPKKFSVEGHVIHVEDMIEAIEQDRDPLIPGLEGRKSVELIVSMYESSKKEGWVRLDG